MHIKQCGPAHTPTHCPVVFCMFLYVSAGGIPSEERLLEFYCTPRSAVATWICTCPARLMFVLMFLQGACSVTSDGWTSTAHHAALQHCQSNVYLHVLLC
jgi:hypothetical protein